jgi:hypothetical protein
VTDEDREKQAGPVPLHWFCTNRGYRIEGEFPQERPECGADREEFVTPDATLAPVSTLTLTVTPSTRSSP